MLALRRLSQLVVLSEELNFHRAADRLHLTQPALSRSISHLEREVGAPLVIRSTRSVQLTEVGRRLVTRAQPLLEELDGAVDEARAAGRQRQRCLRVGFKAGAAGRLLTPTVKAFEADHPDIEVELSRLEWSDQVGALLEDRVDIAFVWLPAPVSSIVTEVLMSEPRCIGLAREHPLAMREHVTIGELAGEPVVTSESVPPEIACWWSAIPRPDGSTPPLGPSVGSVEEMLEAVARGRGVCFVARSFEAFYGRPDVVFIPVLDLEPAPIALAWRHAAERPILSRFRDMAMKTARELSDRQRA